MGGGIVLGGIVLFMINSPLKNEGKRRFCAEINYFPKKTPALKWPRQEETKGQKNTRPAGPHTARILEPNVFCLASLWMCPVRARDVGGLCQIFVFRPRDFDDH
jgi:hypothetical protein